jgi:hypothetical protein
VFGARPEDVAGLQTTDKETHPVPSGLLPRQMEEFTRILRGQIQ